MIFYAPAKVNLSLHVLGKRADGFHELETLMVPLPGLVDRLAIEKAEAFSFSCDLPDLPVDEGNLVVKAVRLFEARTALDCRVRISLGKTIPHGAGLGGGSSDAAVCLLALNKLTKAGVSMADLLVWAGELGSDVPFFLHDRPCWCRGRGELVEPIEASLDRQVVLLKPAFGVSTPDAYGRWEGSQELPGVEYGTQTVSGIDLVNDLERPVFEKHLFLAEMKMWLLAQEGVEAALMSGSGSTMMAILAKGGDGASLVASAQSELDPKLWAWVGEA